MIKKAFGVDIGGTGIKGAPVDLRTGALSADRLRIPTPQPSTPEAVADTVTALVESFEIGRGVPVGVTFPAVIQHGVAQTAANVDQSWIGADVDTLLTERTGHEVFVVNDADAAGIAEMEFGAGRRHKGVVLVITLGTGVGSAMFVDGRLVPNAELGHIPYRGESIERYMAESARQRDDLDWESWAGRLQEYFSLVEFLLNPTLIIVGGGVSKHHRKFLPLLDLRTPIVPAELRNEAGIVGAAALARRSEEDRGAPRQGPATGPLPAMGADADRSAKKGGKGSGAKKGSKGSAKGDAAPFSKKDREKAGTKKSDKTKKSEKTKKSGKSEKAKQGEQVKKHANSAGKVTAE